MIHQIVSLDILVAQILYCFQMAEKKSQGEMSENEQYDCQFFYEDEVYRYQEKIGKIQYGIVLENSEYASSDEDSDDETPSESHKLKKGQIRVAWYPTGKENILSERKVNNFLLGLNQTSHYLIQNF